MKCYVIAHPRSLEITACKAALQRFQWPFEIFPAVDGWTITQQDWQAIGVKLGGGKLPNRPGAQGCWHSHFRLWQKCLDSGQDCIILEHDALVTDRLPAISVTDTLIKLFKDAPVKTHPIYGTWSKGAHAYAISPVLADHLVRFARQHGAEALDKHLGDKVVPWQFYDRDLVILDAKRSRSSTSAVRASW